MEEQILLKILAKLDDLEKRIERLESAELREEERKKAVFASLKKVEELSNQIRDVRTRVKPLLERAAEAAIEHYRVQPPERR